MSYGQTELAARVMRLQRESVYGPLVISARIREPGERAYFDQQVRPLLGPDDDVLAEQQLAALVDLMGHAAALVNPITWPEPFGLVMAQALATATPVLAFPNGAAPEIIDHGRTGYLCRGEDEMTAAVARVPQISRRQCRVAAERRFSLARMAADYDRLYRAILQHPGRPVLEGTGTGTMAVPADRDHHRNDFTLNGLAGQLPAPARRSGQDDAIGGDSVPGIAPSGDAIAARAA